MWATRRNLQAHPKILQIPVYQNKNFLKKTMISTLKIKISQQFVWELKNISKHHINQSKRKKIPKKYVNPFTGDFDLPKRIYLN
jgi:hypothetical protein